MWCHTRYRQAIAARTLDALPTIVRRTAQFAFSPVVVIELPVAEEAQPTAFVHPLVLVRRRRATDTPPKPRDFHRTLRAPLLHPSNHTI
jgi:hypothetical protein